MTDAFIPPSMTVTVSAVVRRGDALLLIRDSYGEFKDVWTFPSGFVDNGEQPDAAAIRETHEEAGIVCAIEGLISATTLVWRGAPMVYLVFLARYVSGEPQPDHAETRAAAFLDRAALDSLPVDGQNLFLARRILSGEIQVLAPHTDASWHPMYRTTYA